MKIAVNKIIFLTSIFLISTIGIAALVYNQSKQNELVCATEIPQPICGTELNLSENAQDGKYLFKANCAACHKLYKNMVGPSLKGIVQREEYPSNEYFIDYVLNENKLLENNDEHAKAINTEYDYDYIHQFKLSNLETSKILEYLNE
ncbi:c-type cytochrome [Jejudonia soesokkakensis]|uniref:C-type cytochrome n=1 Tax=Jejudonia soesokkakensis TaxID=1323432 RepID=A0ABW2MPP2_9FLAO